MRFYAFFLLFLTALFYLSGSFMNVSFDPALWNKEALNVLTSMYILVSFLTGVSALADCFNANRN